MSRSVHGIELTAAGKAFLDHARLALAQVDAAVEAAVAAPEDLGGRHGQQADSNLPGAKIGVLSPTFPAGEMVFFIPWRVVAEESGAAHFGFGGAALLDLLGPMVRPPAAPSLIPL
jgi:hypothetical protein